MGDMAIKGLTYIGFDISWGTNVFRGDLETLDT